MPTGWFFYQVSGIYASGRTPLRLSSRIAADHGDRWYACGYLVATVVLSVGATVLLKTKSTPDSP
jgi:hypothetical protein